jgi:phage recombination protein Bet
MSEVTDLVIYNDDRGNEVQLSPAIIKAQLVSGNADLVSNQEVAFYLKLCETKKFNPFNKDCYLIKYSAKAPASMVTSVDVFKRRMEAHPMMDGFKLGVVVESMNEDCPEPIYREDSIVPAGTALIGAWMEVYRKDWKMPVRCAVNISEYEQFHWDYDKKCQVLNKNWETMRPTMITKCVIGCAGRLAFPSDFQGMYLAEEMGEEREPVVAEIVTHVEIPKATVIDAEPEAPIEGEVIDKETGEISSPMSEHWNKEADPESEKPKRKRRTREQVQADMAAANATQAEAAPEPQDGEELANVIETTLPVPVPAPKPAPEAEVIPVGDVPPDSEFVDITPEYVADDGFGDENHTQERNGLYRTLVAKADAYAVAKGISRKDAREKVKTLSYKKCNVRSMKQLTMDQISDIIVMLDEAVTKYSAQNGA